MNVDTGVLGTLWGVFGSVVFVIAWFIRLESKVLYLEKDHENFKTATNEANKVIWTKLDSIQATMNQVLQVVGELKGKVD